MNPKSKLILGGFMGAMICAATFLILKKGDSKKTILADTQKTLDLPTEVGVNHNERQEKISSFYRRHQITKSMTEKEARKVAESLTSEMIAKEKIPQFEEMRMYYSALKYIYSKLPQIKDPSSRESKYLKAMESMIALDGDMEVDQDFLDQMPEKTAEESLAEAKSLILEMRKKNIEIYLGMPESSSKLIAEYHEKLRYLFENIRKSPKAQTHDEYLGALVHSIDLAKKNGALFCKDPAGIKFLKKLEGHFEGVNEFNLSK